ncbi:hypothetical protein LWI28_010779 [Acer negundo]|uniref:Uncharacterized protein n=1 Tax=Acer negundo TaxID=4023 RepID=A0AAD5JK40_ACENE|nr:hypothetical protein LWI28_010779 [Acer negundo]
MEIGSQDCLKERQECVLEEEEVIFKEIGELEKENTKLKLEVYLLKTENGMLKTKVHNISTLNKSLEEHLVELAKKEELGSKNLEELATLSTEFKEENGRRSRKMLLSVETSTKAMLDLQERLNRKEDELKRAKVKECDLIVQLDGVENVVKSLQYGIDSVQNLETGAGKQCGSITRTQTDREHQGFTTFKNQKNRPNNLCFPSLNRHVFRVLHVFNFWQPRCQGGPGNLPNKGVKFLSDVQGGDLRFHHRVSDTDFEDCLEYFKERDIVVERCIALDELADTPIPQVVETRG